MLTTGDTCTVVICDDQAAFRQVLSVVLGLEPELKVVGEAADGVEAIRIVGALRPDLVLLDIAMPELDGLEALPRIRAASPGTRVVMLTGIVTETARDRAREGGASFFLEKGTNVQGLVGRIKEICAAGRS